MEKEEEYLLLWQMGVPPFRFLTLCIRWGGDKRYPNTTGDYPFERKIFPSVSST